MNGNTHTPGPKLIEWTPGNWWMVTEREGKGYTPLAEYPPPAQAAHLIAAAPDLLEAVRELVAEHDANERHTWEDSGGTRAVQDSGGIVLARMAIAKAEGGQA